jgi:hypothetical protein
VTKTATVSLHANSYEVDPALVGRKVELVFDPLSGIPDKGSYVQRRIMSGVVPGTWQRAQVGPVRTA